MIMYGESPHTNPRLSKDDRTPGISTGPLQQLDCDIVISTYEKNCFSVAEFV